MLQDAGVDAVLFCNEADIPYQLEVGPEIPAAMAAVIGELHSSIRVPFGVNILWDARASLALARATGAAFIREVLTGVYESDIGMIAPSLGDLAAYRDAIGAADVALFGNITPEFSSTLGTRTVAERARSASFLGLDAILISGPEAGVPFAMSDLRAAKDAVPQTPVLANTGVKADRLAEILPVADGVIVGTSLEGRRHHLESRRSGPGAPVHGHRAGGPLQGRRGQLTPPGQLAPPAEPTRPRLEAVILDMDGLLIDTEPVWRVAQAEVFAGLGVQLSEQDLLDSTGQPTEDMIPLWRRRQPAREQDPALTDAQVADQITDRIIAHVMAEGQPMAGRHRRDRPLPAARPAAGDRLLVAAAADRRRLRAAGPAGHRRALLRRGRSPRQAGPGCLSHRRAQARGAAGPVPGDRGLAERRTGGDVRRDAVHRRARPVAGRRSAVQGRGSGPRFVDAGSTLAALHHLGVP